MCLLYLYREMEGGLSLKRELCLKQKNNVEGPCQDLLKSCVLFGEGLEGCNEEKNGEATERRVYIVKCEETLFEGGL